MAFKPVYTEGPQKHLIVQHLGTVCDTLCRCMYYLRALSRIKCTILSSAWDVSSDDFIVRHQMYHSIPAPVLFSIKCIYCLLLLVKINCIIWCCYFPSIKCMSSNPLVCSVEILTSEVAPFQHRLFAASRGGGGRWGGREGAKEKGGSSGREKLLVDKGPASLLNFEFQDAFTLNQEVTSLLRARWCGGGR